MFEATGVSLCVYLLRKCGVDYSKGKYHKHIKNDKVGRCIKCGVKGKGINFLKCCNYWTKNPNGFVSDDDILGQLKAMVQGQMEVTHHSMCDNCHENWKGVCPCCDQNTFRKMEQNVCQTCGDDCSKSDKEEFKIQMKCGHWRCAICTSECSTIEKNFCVVCDPISYFIFGKALK